MTDYKIKSFNSSTGSSLAEWQIRESSDDDTMSIALSANGKSIASAGCFVSFGDTSTHTQLGTIEETHSIDSIALYVVSQLDQKPRGHPSSRISGGIPLDSYLPGNVSTIPKVDDDIHSFIFLFKLSVQDQVAIGCLIKYPYKISVVIGCLVKCPQKISVAIGYLIKFLQGIHLRLIHPKQQHRHQTINIQR